MWDSRYRQRVAVIVSMVFAAQQASAAQVMKKVWFPKGIITWHTTGFTGGLRSGVPAAMDYFEQRTPLRISESSTGKLEIRPSTGLFNGNYGGETKGYRNAGKNKPLIRLSSKNVTTANEVRNTLMHEMGHALGFTHEFQRADRKENGVTICTGCSLDPFDFDIVSDKQATILTPYDFSSQFATGYDGVTPKLLSPPGALLSALDIDAIYRVYGTNLDSNPKSTDRFGVAVTTGDYDGDGTDDIAVASVEKSETSTTQRSVFINFFKGVVTGPADNDAGTSYMPWFRHFTAMVADDDRSVALASGDLKKRASDSTVTAGRDGIDEVVVGLPGGLNDDGLVQVLTVNIEDRFMPGDHPWGGKGVFTTTGIRPETVGLTSASDRRGFGRAVMVAKLTASSSDDLVIGVPNTIASEGTRVARDTGLLVILPGGETTAPLIMRNPSGAMTSLYGSALGVVNGLWKFGSKALDALVVGAPGEESLDATDVGAVYVYRMAVNDKGVPAAPAFSRKIMEPGDGMQFGAAVAGFLTNQGAFSWFPSFHLVVGSPKHSFLKDKGGAVWLYDIGEDGSATRVALRTMPGADAGADFGASLAVHGANCTNGGCSRGSVNLAIGAPRATVSGVRGGRVFRWQPWNDVDKTPVETVVPEVMVGGGEGADLGTSVAAIREHEGKGGFVIGAPGLAVFTGTAMIPAGSAHVHLNKGYPGSWSGWSRNLSKLTVGDRRPEN